MNYSAKLSEASESCQEVYILCDGSPFFFESHEVIVPTYGRLYASLGDRIPLTKDILRESIKRGKRCFFFTRKACENMGFGETHEYNNYFPVEISI